MYIGMEVTSKSVDEKSNKKRFEVCANQNDFSDIRETRIPKTTQSNTKWAAKVWNDWAENRNSIGVSVSQHDRVPIDFSEVSAAELNFWLQYFYVEVRKRDGEKYIPNTLYQLACGLLRHLRNNFGRFDLNFLDDKDPNFVTSWQILDGMMKKMHAEGLGCKRESKNAITTEHEKLLWDTNTINLYSSLGLSYGVFFYTCKCFGLRGRDEHRSLEVTQFAFGTDSVGSYVQYIGRESKNIKHGVHQRNVQNKVIKQYANRDDTERCVVALFNKYISYIPSKGPFYRRPLARSDDKIQFSLQVIGKNLLGDYMSRMFKSAGIEGEYTNHCGKVRFCKINTFSMYYNTSRKYLKIISVVKIRLCENFSMEVKKMPTFSHYLNLTLG